jgi:hypothetical protein
MQPRDELHDRRGAVVPLCDDGIGGAWVLADVVRDLLVAFGYQFVNLVLQVFHNSSSVLGAIFGKLFSLRIWDFSTVHERPEGMAVADGQAAGLVWQSLVSGGLTEAERQQKREALLDYCGQDTLALVRLLEILRLSSI